ncbi:restriction endonuclease [Clavibacter californiensis]|uniref:Restriction endonuclease type IV Mrr domain-containing protein n=1 Tax=Clavibacter californiensis TaxID=1401995 RepID=A0ABX9N7C4_9MICO|nr:restriction endonuclease [Clavibacter californiensis]RII93108.1 hypothetical protein DZF98_05235 [Clavibacter californiensis]UKF80398.1 restriction endonuclease [Clavibacter californiensis]
MNSENITTDDDSSVDLGLKTSSRWKLYEREVEARLRELDNRAHIEWDARRMGKISGAMRQIDVIAENPIVGEIIGVVVECKAYARPVDVGKVDEFVGKLQDLGAGVGLLYALNGVTPAARRRAELNSLPRIVLRDLGSTAEAPQGGKVVIEDGWAELAAEALGYSLCGAEHCFGEVFLGPWRDGELQAGLCDSCGSLNVQCTDPRCGDVNVMDVGDNVCFSCDATYYVDHDSDGMPADVSRI